MNIWISLKPEQILEINPSLHNRVQNGGENPEHQES